MPEQVQQRGNSEQGVRFQLIVVDCVFDSLTFHDLI